MTIVTNGELVSLAILCVISLYVVVKILKLNHKAWSNNFVVGKNSGIMDVNNWGKK